MGEEFAGGKLLELVVTGEEAEDGKVALEALAEFGNPLAAGAARGKRVLEWGMGIGGGGAEEEGGDIGQAVSGLSTCDGCALCAESEAIGGGLVIDTGYALA